jgi:Xaa-Pro aminopeptidase
VGVRENLVDLVWGKDRPARPSEKVRVHPEKYAGKPFLEKIADLRKELQQKKKAGFIICMTVPILCPGDELIVGSNAR